MPDNDLPIAPQQTPFNIGEEFSTPSKKLPPVQIVIACIVTIAAAIAVFSFVHRPHSFASGSIDTLTTVEVPGQSSVMLAMNVSVHNNGSVPYVIHDIQATLDSGANHFTDQPASAVDFDRYYQAFPDLKKVPLEPLIAETRIAPGASLRGTVIFLFPVTPDVFANRTALKVIIQPYDQPMPLVLMK